MVNINKQSLANMLSSYNVLVIGWIILLVLGLVLYGSNKNGFNKTFGTELFVIVPMMFFIIFTIREFIFIGSDPNKSWLLHIDFFKNIINSPFLSDKKGIIGILIIIVLLLVTLFSVLGIAGIFSDKPPENNTAVVINCLILIVSTLIMASIYFKNKQKDDTILSTLDPKIQELYNLRTKFTLGFVAFLIGITLLYFLNPWNIMAKIGGPTVFFTLFVGIIFVIMIMIYQYFLSNTGKIGLLGKSDDFLSLFVKGAYILGALLISGGLIYGALKLMGIFEQDAAKPESWGHIIFNLVIFCAMLSIIYRLANAGGFLDQNPYYRLIVNTLLYIPCLLVTVTHWISELLGFTVSSGNTAPTKKEIIMLVLSLLLFTSYFVWVYLAQPYLQSSYLKQGGKQLINQPIPIDILTNVADYQSLNNTDQPSYQYAISFWFYIDAFPPSVSSAYNKIVPILSYGETPCIKYSSNDNTIYITTKQMENEEYDNNEDVKLVTQYYDAVKNKTINSPTWKKVEEDVITTDIYQSIEQSIENVKNLKKMEDYDADGNRIIYKHKNVLLQKWNHMVLNYNGGTLDIFYNGQLVKSAIKVVPYIKLDMLTTGFENGISGNISNLIYFKEPLDILTIHTLYNSLKTKNPPVISDNKNHLIPLSP